MAAVCDKCGAPIQDGSNFCAKCGKRMSGAMAGQPGTKREAPKIDKGFIAIICLVFFALALLYGMWSFVNYEVGQIAEMQKPKVIAPVSLDYRDCHIMFLRYVIENASSSKPCLYIYYQFENNGDKEKDIAYSFDYLVYQTAYQNNIKLDTCYLFSGAGKDSDVLVKPGGVVTVCKAFYLRNLSSPVEVTMSTNYLIFNQDLAKMTIPLK